MKNNYNQSTSGVNLELSCFYDSGLSQMNFDDNFQTIDNSDYKFYFTDYGQNPEFEGFYKAINKKALVDDAFLKGFENQHYTKKEQYQWTREELESEYSDYFDEETQGIEERYNCITATGYSQGDYIEVYAPKDNDWLTSEIVQNYAFDAPINCRIEIDGEDYFLEEGLKSSYEWELGQIIDYAKKTIEHPKKDYILNWLEENYQNIQNIFNNTIYKMKKSQFIVYDNGGVTIDRYTIFKKGDISAADRQGNRGCVSASNDPSGFFQHGGGVIGSHLGKRIDFHDLNPRLKKAIINNF